MRRHHQLEELNSLNATRQPRKGKMSMKEAVAPYLERLAALNAQRQKDMSVHWTDDGKKK